MNTRAIVLASVTLFGCGGSTIGATNGADAGGDSIAIDAADAGATSDAPIGDTSFDGAACPVTATPAPGLVVTDRGAMIGSQIGASWAYLGVPYAAPPTGALRWRPPQPAPCWTSTLSATAFGPICPQSDAAGTAAVTGDEDCLQLNVWTPQAAVGASATLPVLVFVHGGGNVVGSAAEIDTGVHVYDGRALSEKTGAVVVTLNYRLGALGFLALSQLATESGNEGNYGLLDQIAALRWVQTNIAAFGGDKTKVLLFGESAGGLNVCSLLTTPLSAGLYHAALIESGGCDASTKAAAEAVAQNVVTGSKCNTASDPVACMRALSAAAIVGAYPVSVDIAGKGTGYGATIDGVVMTEAPLATIAAGKHNHVPLVIGNNSDETSKSVPAIATDADYQAAVKAAFPTGTIASQILAQYPSSAYASPQAALVAVTSDAKFICPARTIAKAVTAAQTEPVFRYMFTHPLDDAPKLKAYGAWHGVELLYVFQDVNIAGYVPSAGEKSLADSIDGYWSRMASGDPNGGGSVAWPKYDATDPYLQLDEPIAASAGYLTPQCDFWATLAL